MTIIIETRTVATGSSNTVDCKGNMRDENDRYLCKWIRTILCHFVDLSFSLSCYLGHGISQKQLERNGHNHLITKSEGLLG